MTLMQLAPLTTGEVVGWAAAVVVSLLNYKIKYDVKTELEALRKEFSGTFISAPMATEQRSQITYRLERVEEEAGKNRDRIYEMSDLFTRQVLENFSKFEEGMRDKARRLSAAETKLCSNDELLHDFASRLLDLERSFRDHHK